jgi:eukaryotic-like serine/threonine-protein kinase
VADAEFWSRVDAVFNAAVEIEGDPEARAALIARAAAGDDAVVAEVRSLLAAHDRSGDFLGPVEAEPPASLRPGATLGAYRLVAKIGEGGMGDVYRAERADGAFGRAVAVKVTRGGLVEGESAARFRTERQILATLQHPNVVTLLDGGTTADGRAFLVMELVDGVPITAYCADRRLGLDERLALFRQVCAAAHYAHRHAIVHRDLKPANVLVTVDGVAKVLDFGVAKLLAAEATDGHTVPGLLPGPLTPNYASPEQLRGLPVTTASDVYALGVLLYELVTGGRPYETTGQPLDRVIELVVRAEPTRPSEAIPRAGAVTWDRRRLRGDLDAIVLRALAKDPEARYASAEQLADDVARFVARQPVSAREPSAIYLLRKLAARHRVAAIASGLALIGVLGGFGVALWQRQEAERERRRAEARLADVRALANALIFKIHDAVVPLPGSTPVRKTIVAEALGYLEKMQRDLGDDPKLRFELAGAYLRIATVLGYPQSANLGDRPGAIAALQQAHRLIAGQARHPDAPLDTVDRYIAIERQLGTLYKTVGRYADAKAATAASVQRAEQLYARYPNERRARWLLANARFEVAWNIADPRAALPEWERTRVLYDAILAESPDDSDAMRNVALVEKYTAARHELLVDRQAALRHYQRALELDERRLAKAPDNPQARLDTAIDLASIAGVYEDLGDFERGGTLRARSLAMRRALSEADPQNVLLRGRLAYALSFFARAEALRGRVEAAVPPSDDSLRITRELVATTKDSSFQVDLAVALTVRGFIEERRGSRAAACGAYREAVTYFDRLKPPDGVFVNLAASAAKACDAPARHRAP